MLVTLYLNKVMVVGMRAFDLLAVIIGTVNMLASCLHLFLSWSDSEVKIYSECSLTYSKDESDWWNEKKYENDALG